jgi:hypothetical protein
MKSTRLLLFSALFLSLCGCSLYKEPSLSLTYQESLVRKAIGEYELISSRNTSYNYEYCYITIESDNVISSRYKIENTEERTFKTNFSCRRCEKDHYIEDNRLEVRLQKYDNYILTQGYNIILDFDESDENPQIKISSQGITEKGYIIFNFAQKQK